MPWPARPSGAGRPRVLFANNYSMREARRLWEGGLYPEHHLYGALELERRGWAVHPVDDPGGVLARVSAALHGRAGALGAETALWRKSRAHDIIYAANADLVRGLALLKLHGRASRRLVAVVHHLSDVTSRNRCWGTLDLAVCFNAGVRGRLLVEAGRDPERTITLPWGPDLRFPGYWSAGEEMIVSSGKTERDWGTLVRAMREVGVPGVLHGSGMLEQLPPNVTAVANAAYAEVLGDLRRAMVVAVPLNATSAPYGITELNEALALGKPVVMTRNPNIGFDIEDVGCGIWVEPSDAAGWAHALSSLAADPDRRRQMGERGRRFAEEHWNADRFSAGLADAVAGLAGR